MSAVPTSPVLLIPGFTGVRLKTRAGPDDNFDLWLNHAAIGRQSGGNFEPTPWWLNAMSLQDDGVTPKQSPEYNLPLEGMAAISVLDPSPKYAHATAYFQPLIDLLQRNGYDHSSMRAATYDWRCPPSGLELRHGFFSKLKATIEELVESSPTQTPVTVIAHSLGNRVTQYFLQMLINGGPSSQEWIQRHVGRFVAVSALWLGVPKSIREALTGATGLGLTNITNLKAVYQSYGALPWMLPVTERQYALMNTDSFCFVGNEPLSVEQGLAAGAPSTLGFMKNYYLADPAFTKADGLLGSLAVDCPAVAHLNVLHATGQNTEVGAYYLRAKDGLVLDTGAVGYNPNFLVEEGIRYETPATRQSIDDTANAGDGFLPYGSLRYFTRWQQSFPQADITGKEFPGRTHYDILSSNEFLASVLDLLQQPI